MPRTSLSAAMREGLAMYELTAEQQSIVNSVAKLCSQFDDSYWRERDENHEFPWDFYNVFADGGWLGMTMPEEFGGGGLGILEASLMLDEIAASGAAMNGASPIHLTDRKRTRLNSSHYCASRMQTSA